MKLQTGVQLSDSQAERWRKLLDTRFSSLRSTRLSWWAHWAQLAENFLPRRYRWFVTPNQSNRGAQMNQNIIDETGLIAARTLAAGLLSGLTSPTRPWFKLGFRNKAVLAYGPVKVWLSQVEQILYRVLAGSNFYQGMGVLYHDEAIFGSAAMICYEDKKDVVRFYNPALGEFFFWVDERLAVAGLAREYTYTTQQTVTEFDLKNVSPSVQQSYRSGGASLDREVVVCHVIEPNSELYDDGEQSIGYPVPKKFEWREVFWEQGSATSLILRAKGYNEKPFVGARWDVTSNDPYGRSPGMDALPATRQLQIEQRRKAEAIDKMVRPPMVGHVSMKNEPNSITPGAMNYSADMANVGFKPAFTVDPRLTEMMEDIKEVQQRINEVFFVPLFMMISQLETVRTATEIDARREEKLIQLGPVIERAENEVLDPLIERVFAIAYRRGLLPPAPEEVQGEELEIQYVSMLAEAQRAASTASIERILGIAGNLVAVAPDVMDNIDIDATVEQYADDLALPPHLIRPLKAVAAIRQNRQRQQQLAAAAEATPGLAAAAKNLSETKTGAGQSVFDQIMGNA